MFKNNQLENKPGNVRHIDIQYFLILIAMMFGG